MKRFIRPLGLIVVAAAIGYVIARADHSGAHRPADALVHTAAAPTFTVHYPRDWQTVDPPGVRGLSLGHAVAVGPGGARQGMQIGTAKVPTVGALPTALERSLPRRPRAQTVALGAYRFDRYLDLAPRGAHEVVSVYLLATTRSTIVATCTTPHPDGAFTAACESVLRTLTLARGVAVSGRVDAAYALELNEILASLNQARLANANGLEASSLARRARAAQRLGTAEERAAGTAERLSAGSATTANDTLVSSLREAASGYRALARAARHEDRSAYEAAQRTLESAQHRLAGAFKTLARLGYELR